MPLVTIIATNDAFNNNISGFYDTEDFLISSSYSSSDSVQNDALFKFTTVGAGIPSNAKLISATFNVYESSFSDINGVGNLIVYSDPFNVWGTLDASDPPIASIGFGTVQEGVLGQGVGWQSRALHVTDFPKSGQVNIGIDCSLSDLGPTEARFDSIRNASNRKAYIDIVYALNIPQMTMMGVGC